jgi:hypothetical protein
MNAGCTKTQYTQAALPFTSIGGERLLQYIWLFQYFNKTDLRTSAGEQVEVIFPGTWNKNQGPDFQDAQIKINETTLVGSVELHLKASQWLEHGHQSDSNFKNVVLHVVYENNLPDLTNNIPVLELQNRISHLLLSRYNTLMQSASFIACANSITQVNDITWCAWKERLLAERLTRKSEVVISFLQSSNHHWEETFWWMLARNFGMKVNADAFESIARSLPVNLLAKHKSQIHQLEALLLGQAGLLSGQCTDLYSQLLQREYLFLKKKYKLNAVSIPVFFLRMRPGNFPSVRLAQLAMLIHQSVHLFSIVLELETVDGLKKLLGVTANDYWHYHYKLDEPSAYKKKSVGATMIDNIIINTVVPTVFAYGLNLKQEKYKTKALSWLEEITAEDNAVTKGFFQCGITARTAFDSQALIELKTQYCDRKRCLSCSVGNALLRSNT